jgi:signal transduction histidine kinase
MDTRRIVEHDRKETDEKLREERERTDSLLGGEPVARADDVLDQGRAAAEERLRQVRDDVDQHLDRQAEILPQITEALEEVADSLASTAESLTGVADMLHGSDGVRAFGADTEEAAVGLVEAVHDLDATGADAPGGLVETLAEIAGGVAEVAADLDAERQAADDTLRKERELTDHILGEQIEHTESVLLADVAADRGTLDREREATDRELAKERHHTDEAMDHVFAALADEQEAHGAIRREFASRNEFLAIVSHDLRGPLSSIALASGLIGRLSHDAANARVPRQIKDAAERIQRSASVMERLIDDLLDFASFEDGKLRVAAEEHDAGALVERVVDVFRPVAAAKSVTLEVSLPPTPVHGIFDPDRMLQVVSNVLQNAIKFTSAGGTVRVRAARAGRECVIAIADTGIGISESELPKIFDRFRQVDGGRGGLGLGLYISKWIVEAHGGRIWVDSHPGDGSTFYVALPAEA